MNLKSLFIIVPVFILSGCETMQSPQQRQQATARQQLAARHAEERALRFQGQVESVEMENARMMQELQQLRQEVHSYSSQIAQLNSQMKSLEAKQQREMAELIKRVEGLLKKSVASPSTSRASRGAGYEVVVERGYTLSAIAQKCGTTVQAIKQANNLKSDNIYVGQKLFIPE
ncbi:MAG TPA: LysM peptidoglycan-binding domain-containing protein [Pontiella sp.]